MYLTWRKANCESGVLVDWARSSHGVMAATKVLASIRLSGPSRPIKHATRSVTVSTRRHLRTATALTLTFQKLWLKDRKPVQRRKLLTWTTANCAQTADGCRIFSRTSSGSGTRAGFPGPGDPSLAFPLCLGPWSESVALLLHSFPLLMLRLVEYCVLKKNLLKFFLGTIKKFWYSV